MGEAVEEVGQAAGVAWGDAGVVAGVSFLEGGGYADAAVAEDFAKGADGACGLMVEDVPRPGGGGGDYDGGAFAFHQRARIQGCVIGCHGVCHAVKQAFQLPWHVAPIAGRAKEYEVMVFQQ